MQETTAKIIAFDLDGTLTESKTLMTSEMSDVLSQLAQTKKVAIISGGSWNQFGKQLLPLLKPSSNIILLPTDGSERFEYDTKSKDWKLTDKESFSGEVKNKARAVLEKIISSGAYDIPTEHKGEYIEDRDTELTFSALGQDASLADKEKWDPDQSKRQKIKAALEKELPDVSIGIAGTTSIDILQKGFNKAKGLELLLEKFGLEKKDMIFVGDAVFPGGNDYSAYEAGIETIKVSGPKETAHVIRKILEGKKVNPASVFKEPIFPPNPVAYFCAEYALDDDSKMYAGGLGILAGDYLLELADHNVPFIALGLKYGDAIPPGFSTLTDKNGPVLVHIPLGNEIIDAKVWHRELASNTHILLLDTYINENVVGPDGTVTKDISKDIYSENRKITSNLYDPHFYTRVKQQMVLGIGGLKLLEKLNISPTIYHLNEGHTAFGGVGVMVERPQDLKKIVASKHTILSEAGLHISKKDFIDLLGTYCKENNVSIEDVFQKGKYELDPDIFSTTKFLINISQRKNGVSVLHTVFERKRHSNSELFPLTNGVYQKRWQSPSLVNSSRLSDEELLNAKKKLRGNLFSYVKTISGKQLNPEVCTLVWARRFAAYKRPYLLFSDLERLTALVSSQQYPLQIVISGKAHVADEEGQAVVQKIISFSNDPRVKSRIVYLPDYMISVARQLTQGADIWLNTPERGKEACGTSGMKAALNGGLQCSISDGWVDEENWAGRGWILPEEKTAQTFYDLLEHEILPSFYGSADWVAKMRSTIELVEKNYTAERMMDDYRKKLYLLV